MYREYAYRIINHIQFHKHTFDEFIQSWIHHAEIEELEKIYDCMREDFTLDVVKFINSFPEEPVSVDD